MKRFSIFLVHFALALLPVLLYGQWQHDFENGGLEEWSGQVSNFVINTDNQLQLDAPSAGNSYIYRESKIDFDTVTIGLYHKLDFAPSDNNRSTMYLALDNTDPSSARGYALEIGENGGDDAIIVYYLDNGSRDMIASGTLGAVANEPAIIRLLITILPNGLWTIDIDYSGGLSFSPDIEFIDNNFDLKESQFFGLSCTYSATRADKFFYDDMFVKAFEPDITPPILLSAVPLSSTQLELTFSEELDANSANLFSNYMLSNGSAISQIMLEDVSKRVVTLTYESAFDPSLAYTLSVSGISDVNGNIMTTTSVDFIFPVFPILEELYISEILFDPYPDGEDFVELYNASSKNLNLRGLVLRNASRDETKTILSEILLPPKSYIALTEEKDFLVQNYKPDPEAIIVLQDIPAFNNDLGNITIINKDGITLDSFDYDEDYHFTLIDDTEGVSLERITFSNTINDPTAWASSSQGNRFATPGYKNSIGVSSGTSTSNFTLVSKTFSPNQDGEDDVLILQYNLEKAGYLASINIYDGSGFLIKELANNYLLSTDGILIWDGTTEDGDIANMGIYVMTGKIFHPDGDVKDFRLAVVLADFLD